MPFVGELLACGFSPTYYLALYHCHWSHLLAKVAIKVIHVVGRKWLQGQNHHYVGVVHYFQYNTDGTREMVLIGRVSNP